MADCRRAAHKRTGPIGPRVEARNGASMKKAASEVQTNVRRSMREEQRVGGAVGHLWVKQRSCVGVEREKNVNFPTGRVREKIYNKRTNTRARLG